MWRKSFLCLLVALYQSAITAQATSDTLQSWMWLVSKGVDREILKSTTHHEWRDIARCFTVMEVPNDLATSMTIDPAVITLRSIRSDPDYQFDSVWCRWKILEKLPKKPDERLYCYFAPYKETPEQILGVKSQDTLFALKHIIDYLHTDEASRQLGALFPENNSWEHAGILIPKIIPGVTTTTLEIIQVHRDPEHESDENHFMFPSALFYLGVRGDIHTHIPDKGEKPEWFSGPSWRNYGDIHGYDLLHLAWMANRNPYYICLVATKINSRRCNVDAFFYDTVFNPVFGRAVRTGPPIVLDLGIFSYKR